MQRLVWFNSTEFGCFILVVFPLFYALGALPSRTGTPRIVFLLVASYFFYMYWNPVYVLLLIASTVIDYACGLAFLKWPREKRKKLVWISATANLGILAFFKYGKFLYGSVQGAMAHAGIALPDYPATWAFALPVGISFYTFQSMSYTIDLYREKTRVETSFLRFALFVSFFPQLVAGPIEKARHLLREIKDGVPRARPIDAMGAIQQITYGLFKKVAIADSLAVVINPVFASPESYSGALVLTATIFFSFQIYCDFSGYSDIAIGIAKLFGIRISTNFFFPYFATNITQFWRTWHISLSSWLKEYVYFTLGGNRKSRIRTYVNLLVTMLLGGLWHGASWNFVFWGFLHGLYLAIHKRALVAKQTLSPAGGAPFGQWLRIPILLFGGLFTFSLVTLTWIPFRCVEFSDTLACCTRMITWAPSAVGSPKIGIEVLGHCWLLVGMLMAFDAFYKCEFHRWQRAAWVDCVKCVLPAIFVSLSVVFGATQAQQFIYFQF